MSAVSSTWFWFPEYHTGLVYLEQPVQQRAGVLRVAPRRADWLLQFAPPPFQALCFDTEEPKGSESFKLEGGGFGERRRFDPALVSSRDEQARSIVTPHDWEAATVAWLTVDAQAPLKMHQLSRAALRDRDVITPQDIAASKLELDDAVLCFFSGERVGPAIHLKWAADATRVLVTFAGGLDQPLMLELELRECVHSGISIRIRTSHPHRGLAAQPIDLQMSPTKSRRHQITIDPAIERFTIAIATSDDVRLCYRDGHQSNAKIVNVAGPVLAREMGHHGFKPADPALPIALTLQDEMRDASGKAPARDAVANDGARRHSIRFELMQRHGLNDLVADREANEEFQRLPAPLVATLIAHSAAASDDRVNAARRFLHWPAAAQLSLTFGRRSPATRRLGEDDATTAAWRDAGVDEQGLRWLADDPRRQIEILPRLATTIDIGRLVSSLKHFPNLDTARLVDAIEEIAHIQSEVWPGIVPLLCRDGGLHKRATRLVENRARPVTDEATRRDRIASVQRFEADIAAHLRRLAATRRSFAHAGEIEAASRSLGISIAQFVTEIERLTEKYAAPQSAPDAGLDEAAQQLANGTAAEFLFDRNALLAAAHARQQLRVAQAKVVSWLEQQVLPLDSGPPHQTGFAEPDAPSLDRLDERIDHIRQRLAPIARRREAATIRAGLGQSLKSRADQISAPLQQLLERSRNLIGTGPDELALSDCLTLLEQASDAVVVECLKNWLRARHTELLTRYRAVVSWTHEWRKTPLDETGILGRRPVDAETLNALDDALSQFEMEIAGAEARVTELQRQLPATLWVELGIAAQAAPALPQLEEAVASRIAVWRNEIQSADERLARVRAYAQAFATQPRTNAETDREPEGQASPPGPSSAQTPLAWCEALLNWYARREQHLAALAEETARLAGLVEGLLTGLCPTMSWSDKAAGRELAVVLTAQGRPAPSEAPAMLRTAVRRLDAAWLLSGGNDNEHVRDLLWLGRDVPILRGLEAALAATANVNRLLDDANMRPELAEFDRMAATPPAQRPSYGRAFVSLREFIGKEALTRLTRLRTAPDPDPAVEHLAVSNSWQAIDAMRGLQQLATDLAGIRDTAARGEALRAALSRHGLWPPEPAASAVTAEAKASASQQPVRPD